MDTVGIDVVALLRTFSGSEFVRGADEGENAVYTTGGDEPLRATVSVVDSMLLVAIETRDMEVLLDLYVHLTSPFLRTYMAK